MAQFIKSIPRIFKDSSLTSKAFLNALASALDYSAKLVVAFIITPFMVAGLGTFYYGAWQILLRFIGYMSPASGRPTQALKFVLAKEQNSTDYDLKRTFIGSTLTVLALFLPMLAILGALISWFIPYWMGAPEPSVWIIRAACAILVINLIAFTLMAIPQAVLEGENKGYKRMGLATALVFLGGGFTWFALYLNTGIIGVAFAALLATVCQILFYLKVVKLYAPWFGVARPSRQVVGKFLGLSGWFIAWNLIMNLMVSSDVVVLGLLNSVESVTPLTLSKYAPETLITVIAMMVFGILPGLSGIISSGDLVRATRVRGEIMAFSWLIITVLGSTILLWNRTFIGLWVGEQHFIGYLANLLVVISITQFVFIRNDANVIDLTLDLKKKVIFGAASVGVSIIAACLLVYFYKMGIVGVLLGIMTGRLILTAAFPILVGNKLGISLSSQARSIIRPALVTIAFYLCASSLDGYLPTSDWHTLADWGIFILSATVSVVIISRSVFLLGLSSRQRQTLINRGKMIFHTREKFEP